MDQRVLIVDDDEQVLDIASMFVEELGYPVSTARNAAEALEILEEDRTVAILFSDITMPGMDGEQLAERARALRPALRIILTSGWPETAGEGRLRAETLPRRRSDQGFAAAAA